ncbi:MAG: PilZ domain-containing protein [Minwuia sp.]|nr:PilZ domain-containing protein [Minwuia sp.]
MSEHQETAPPPGKDRRRFVRTRVGMPVMIDLGDASTSAHTAINVSAGGLLASPAVEAPEDALCVVRVDGFEPVLEARVVNHRSSGTGLAFTDIGTGEALALWMVERAIRGD